MLKKVCIAILNDIADAPAQGYQVTCFTCHRGAEHPVHSPDTAPKPPGF